MAEDGKMISQRLVARYGYATLRERPTTQNLKSDYNISNPPKTGKFCININPMTAVLVDVKSSWLRRVMKVATPEDFWSVEYNGRGIGYESVLVNRKTVLKQHSIFWFVPGFDFFLGERVARIDVKVSLSLAIDTFKLWVDGELIYIEEPNARRFAARQ